MRGLGIESGTFDRGGHSAVGPRRLVLVSLLMLVFMAVTAAPVYAFSDVESDDWFFTAVEEMSAAGVINGYSDNTFHPYQSVTRAQFAAMLHRILQTPAGSEPFADVYSTDWFHGAVASLYEAGLVKGTSADRFSPGSGVSREQVTSFAMRALAYKWQQDGKTDVQMLPFQEAYQWLGSFRDRWMITDAHEQNVGNAFRLQVINGYSDGRFYPMFTVTRAQAAGMLYRAFFQEVDPPPSGPRVSRPKPRIRPNRWGRRGCSSAGSRRSSPT